MKRKFGRDVTAEKISVYLTGHFYKFRFREGLPSIAVPPQKSRFCISASEKEGNLAGYNALRSPPPLLFVDARDTFFFVPSFGHSRFNCEIKQRGFRSTFVNGHGGFFTVRERTRERARRFKCRARFRPTLSGRFPRYFKTPRSHSA